MFVEYGMHMIAWFVSHRNIHNICIYKILNYNNINTSVVITYCLTYLLPSIHNTSSMLTYITESYFTNIHMVHNRITKLYFPAFGRLHNNITDSYFPAFARLHDPIINSYFLPSASYMIQSLIHIFLPSAGYMNKSLTHMFCLRQVAWSNH